MYQDFEAAFARIEAKFRVKKLPKLKTLIRGAINNISNLTNLLVRKSLLKENFYSYSDDDANSRGINLPEEKAFMDNERPRVIYDRLKAQMNALDYQANLLNEEMDSITEKYLDDMNKVLSYFAFHNLNLSTVGINTRTIKELTDRIITGNDQILKRVVLDNLKLLQDNFNKIKKNIDELMVFKKEKYKALIRFKVFPNLPKEFNEKLFQENPSQYLQKLEKFIALNNADIGFNKNWIAEAINACYKIKEEDSLKKITTMFLDDLNKEDNPTHSIYTPREKLLAIIKIISNSVNILEKLYVFTEQNIKLQSNRKKGFFEQIIDSFRKAMTSASQDDFFQLEYIHPINKSIQNDVININEFMLSIKKKILLFSNLTKEDSKVADKIKRGTEEALFKFIDETYFDMLLTKERILGINGEIRLRINKKLRQNLKDIGEPIEKFEEILKNISELRRKYVLDQEKYMTKK
jgi:hypothetical protein